MTVIRKAATAQVAKLENRTAVTDMHVQSFSCKGECWDCDSCGGSQTH